MRQAGVLAAAGIVALETMRDRLGEDHDNARELAAGIAELAGKGGLSLDVPRVLTNIIYVRVAGERLRNRAITAALKERGILCNAVGDSRIRFVTHDGITRADIGTALAAIAACSASVAGEGGTVH